MTITQDPEQLERTRMTAEQLDQLPDDGMDRWLINGELREKEMTKRNRTHSRVEANISAELRNWLKGRPEPRGEVLAGEAGVVLTRNPDTSVGIDVTYISAETAQSSPADSSWVVGVPVLAVEILSPSDTHEEVSDKVEAYLSAGVKLVWIVDTRFQTITIYRPDAEPQLVNINQTLDADPHLPGFKVAVAEIFSR